MSGAKAVAEVIEKIGVGSLGRPETLLAVRWFESVPVGAKLYCVSPAQQRSAEDDELIDDLQHALSFWHPGVHAGHPSEERAAHDAYLLVGYEGPLAPTAVDLGWISLEAKP